jgi:aspartate racemase
MKQLGLLGGMSWQSTAVYYRELNQLVQARRGGHASAPLLLWSVDFAEIEQLQRAADWTAQGRILADAALRLEAAGVDAIALATNTLHLVADQITAGLTVPFVDLIDVTADAVADLGYTTVGLLATDYTMTSDLYPARLAQHAVSTLAPDAAGRAEVQRVIYDELVRGIVTDQSRAALVDVIEDLRARGAQAIILGCTELAMSLRSGDPGSGPLPLLDTTALHCRALADVILGVGGPATVPTVSELTR